ncbi:MAG: M13 family metallopeptidase [Bacteroidia bacterium]|nr:M13 family metallopeptidase [Bacteroidia bacterium]
MRIKRNVLAAIGLAAGLILGFRAMEEKGVDLEGIDTNVKPTDNFFEYANGTWLKKTPIPETESVWGSFAELRESNSAKIRQLLTNAAQQAAGAGPDVQKVADYYRSGMDSSGRNKKGIETLKAELDLIASMTSTKDVGKVLGRLHSNRISGLFFFYVDQDLKSSTEMIPAIYNSGLGLPDRDYYTRMDEDALRIRKKYTEYMMNLFQEAGIKNKDLSKTIGRIISFETELAKKHLTNVERRDIQRQYNRMSIDSLKKLCPGLNWDDYFRTLGLPSFQKELVINNPAFMQQISFMLENYDLENWQNYLRWNLLNTCADHATDLMEHHYFAFYEQTLKGVKKQKPRWKRVAESVDHSLGDALGKMFVDKYFPPDAKKKVDEMVDYLFAAYRERIKSRTWMSEETKKAALVKLDAIIRKLGYPEQWKDYSEVTVSSTDYIRNMLNAANFEFRRNLNKLGKPVNRKEFGMTTPTINAYYSPSMNEIVFPAGIMQYPFFDAGMDMAINFGAMGGVIGHELTHGFDDQGAQFDAQGNFTMWWKEEDYKQFQLRADKVVKQFDSFTALDTLRVNGKLTLGENIADLGGLTMAYHAMKMYLEKHPELKQKKQGFTPEQRFFMGWAKVWCVKHRDAALKQRLITDVHAPGRFRVNGPLSNMPEFYDAFGVKEGDGMYRKPDERAEIW